MMDATGQVYADFFKDAPDEDKARYAAALVKTQEELLAATDEEVEAVRKHFKEQRPNG